MMLRTTASLSGVESDLHPEDRSKDNVETCMVDPAP